ncbi:MAG: 30S ribosomal protein S13 [Candidatus Thermoplasmatota archaeon]
MSEKTHEHPEAEKQKNQQTEKTEENSIEPQLDHQGKSTKKDKKQAKVEAKKETAKPVKKHGENFQYIIRIANTDINGEKNVIMGLTQIKGVGRHIASFIANASGIDQKTLFGDLNEEQIQKIKNLLENINSSAPSWMLNHRKDLDTGEDLHMISTDVQTQLRDDINLMKMIRSYRGVRHEMGLKVRGQRTSSNGRKGLALGVQRRKEGPSTAAASSGGK